MAEQELGKAIFLHGVFDHLTCVDMLPTASTMQLKECVCAHLNASFWVAAVKAGLLERGPLLTRALTASQPHPKGRLLAAKTFIIKSQTMITSTLQTTYLSTILKAARCRPSLGGSSPADVAAMSDEQLYSLVINMKQPSAPPASMPAGIFGVLEQLFLANVACFAFGITSS